MKDVDAIEVEVFKALKKHIQHDFKAKFLQDPQAKSLVRELEALENLDELKHIKWVWDHHFKHHAVMEQLESLIAKSRLYFYFQEKFKGYTASYVIRQKV